jgi:hypothetical protein
MQQQIIFRETQSFTRAWLVLIVPSTVGSAVLFMHGMVQQLVYGIPWGDRPMSDRSLVMVSVFCVIICLGSLFMFVAGKLITEVRPDGLYIRFFPFHLKYHKIDLDRAKEIVALPQGSGREYAGEGIRLGRKGKGYIASGREGVQVIYEHTRITIGSNNGEGLLEAVHSINTKK